MFMVDFKAFLFTITWAKVHRFDEIPSLTTALKMRYSNQLFELVST